MALGLGALIGIGSTLLGIGKGISQNRKANRLERSNEFPVAEVNERLLENLNQAEMMANTGLSQEQYNQALQNINRAQNAGLRQASRQSGTGSIASILRSAGDSIVNLDVADAEARRQNQLLAMQQRNIVAQDETRVEDWNERQRYINTANQVAALRGAGQQNIFGGIGALGQIGMMGMMGFGGLDGLFGSGQQANIPNTTGLQGQMAGVTTPTNQQPLGLPLGGFRTTI